MKILSLTYTHRNSAVVPLFHLTSGGCISVIELSYMGMFRMSRNNKAGKFVTS